MSRYYVLSLLIKMFMEFREKKYKDSIVTFNLEDVGSPTDLLELLKDSVKPSIRYSILLRVSYIYSESNGYTQYKMLGKQISFSYKYFKELQSFSTDLYTVLVHRLNSGYDTYNYEGSDVISVQILLFRIGKSVVSKVIKVNKNTFDREKSIVENNSSIVKYIKNYDLKPDKNNYGILLEKFGECDSIRLLDGSVVKVNSILFKYGTSNIRLSSNTEFYQNDSDSNSQLIVVNTVDTLTYVNVYTINGMPITELQYEKLGYNHYTCRLSNVKLYIKDLNIYKKEIDIKFPPVYAQPESGKVKRMIQPEWRIGSIDLETYKHKDSSYVYALGFCVKGDVKTYYIGEDYDSDKIVIDCLNDMICDKYNGYTFYSHNLTNYDIHFIFKVLVNNPELYSINPSFRDDRIIGIKITRKVVSNPVYKDVNSKRSIVHKGGTTKTYSIRIIDSCNMLQAELRKLCKTFNTETTKGHFPYDFVNRNNLFYLGSKPDIKYYNNLVGIKNKLTLEEYNSIPSKDWNLKDETLKYLKSDLISLFQVMEEFNKKIYIDYKIQASKSLTISSLSMEIFLRRYYKENIPLIKQNSVYSDIKESYYGGITEVYKPHGTKLYYYDVNSLYPYSALNAMPGRNCIYSDNIGINFKDSGQSLFGFYYCKIKTSELYIGLLPHRTKEGLTMPLGEFEGWYFSEELRYAAENGYQIDVIKGYTFDKVHNVFDKYIKHLYDIKSTTKSDVERQIVKSLLNNLLGRFGLDINKYVTSIVNDVEFKHLIQTRNIRGLKFLDDDKILISYENIPDKNICESHNLDYLEIMKDLTTKSSNSFSESEHHDVSVAISSAVTAYSRVFMSKVKMDILNKGGNIYYTDTDSIVTDIQLDDKLTGNEIGQFKLEHEIAEGYFVSSKTYAFKTTSGVLYFKNKGVYRNALNLQNFKDLYSGKVIDTFRYTTRRDFVGGTAVINIQQDVKLNPSSYRKRIKVFEGNKWVDTKPINNQKFHTLSVNKPGVYNMLLYWGFKLFSSNYTFIFYLIGLIFISMYNLYLGINTLSEISNVISDNNIEYNNEVKAESYDYENIVDINTNKSWINQFIDKFKSNNSLNIEYQKFDSKFKNGFTDKEVNIIKLLHNNYLDQLEKENLELKDSISIMEIKLQKYRLFRLDWDNTTDAIIKEITSHIEKYP